MTFDPTNTFKLRASFRAEGKRRIQRLLSLTRVVLIGHDMLGLQPMGLPRHMRALFPNANVMNKGQSLAVFADWFNGAAGILIGIDGGWTHLYLQRAYDSGLVEISKITKITPQLTQVDNVFFEHAKHELSGIVDATSQKVIRAIATGLRHKHAPRAIYLDVSAAVKSTATIRISLLCNMFVAQLHNQARLNELRRLGVRKVGIVPEFKPGKPIQRDALVNVLTAGDDYVCEECQDISDSGPYELDEAEELLPAHLECRCAFVPAEDERFAAPEITSWFAQEDL